MGAGAQALRGGGAGEEAPFRPVPVGWMASRAVDIADEERRRSRRVAGLAPQSLQEMGLLPDPNVIRSSAVTPPCFTRCSDCSTTFAIAQRT